MLSEQKANIRSIVTLKMDYRDVSKPHGITAIVLALSTNDLGQGPQAVNEHGIYSKIRKREK